MDIFLVYVAKDLILPPTGNLLLAAIGWFVGRRWPRVGRKLIALAVVTLVALSVPVVSEFIARPLESIPPFDVHEGTKGAEAIVVLGGGRYGAAPEFGGADTVHQRTLERLRYGALLAQATGLPVALVGGTVSGIGTPESLLMAEVMDRSFHVPVRWLEAGSRNTAENAQYARLLMPARRILLVTQAMHMRRARRMFEQAGFSVIPAPVGYRVLPVPLPRTIFDFLPALDSLERANAALHEYLGLAWYRLRYPPEASDGT